MKKVYIGILFLIISLQVFSTENRNDSLKQVVAQLSNTFKTGNIESIKESLSPRFSIALGSYPRSLSYHLKILVEYKEIESVEYLSLDKHVGDTTFVNVRYVNKKHENVDSSIAFDAQNRILYSDYLDRFFALSRHSQSKLVAQIPFTQAKDANSIILSIKLNDSDKPLNFLFDSGADGMAILPAKAEIAGVVATSQNEAHVVGGTVKTSISENNKVYLSDSIFLKKQRIAIIPGMSEQYDGIIGLNMAREHIVEVNFDNMLISLYTIGDYQFPDEGHSLAITIPTGVILMPAKLNIVGKKEIEGNFVFDTGANYSLIGFEQFVRKNRLLLTGFKAEGEGTTVSLGVATPVFRGKAFQFKLADDIVIDNMPITMQASSGKNNQGSGHPDGSIGIDVISKYNFTIDMLRKIVHLAPRKK